MTYATDELARKVIGSIVAIAVAVVGYQATRISSGIDSMVSDVSGIKVTLENQTGLLEQQRGLIAALQAADTASLADRAEMRQRINQLEKTCEKLEDSLLRLEGKM
ncbi:hypothetical protein VF14_18355 [Nostoc linckia z18]|uniref:Uncharacterized protein n=2 Tax=Nostoc linckia TaxID=92942 RepID=A0A9Q5Z981_NOSLI|nr:hypothetical protein [Nostoc linckia]PHJ53464.1 hypothetical protein VF02_37240 [Nostoc linckia z1]PHJ81968.1 hypothetical protein VF07_29175 [Nostoc linckia z6]PHJ92866.1 hypothetical protein VF04_27890 [Nostoc linckia z7]PHK00811.1 hypothetical protein VF08_23355 [Nostoc linckia z8]PHK09311.1 hypothetical protein VF09_15950 [Nostoc linckia z9]